MARCLLAWELGSNYGHLVVLRALARELRRRGHACVFAVRALGAAQAFLDPQLGPLVQAPLRLAGGRGRVRAQVSYASLLHNVGFNEPVELAGRIAAWRALFRAFATEFVFADHSPVALVAARTLGIPAAAVGNGFTLPPLATPFPPYRPRGEVPEAVLLQNEVRVLAELNQALARLKLQPFELLRDVFRGARRALLTYAPLDHYEVLRPDAFRGLPDYSYGSAPDWPPGRGPRVFAYLRPGPAVPRLLRVLQRRNARVLLRLAGDADGTIRYPSWPGLRVTRDAVHFRSAAESCDAFVNYGAHSTVAEFLLAGKPGILLPDLQERALTARRAVALGAALAVGGAEPASLPAAVERVLDDPGPRTAARAFAARYDGDDRGSILPRLVGEALP